MSYNRRDDWMDTYECILQMIALLLYMLMILGIIAGVIMEIVRFFRG